MLPLITSVGKTRLGVLELFLNIPVQTIKILIQKCEKYTNKTPEDANEEGDSLNNESFSNNENSNATNNIINVVKKVKKKDFSNNNTSNTPFFLKYIFGSLLLESYFAVNYGLAIYFLQRVVSYGLEMNVTAMAEAHDTYCLAILQNLLIEKKTLSSNHDLTFRLLAKTEISTMYSLAKDLQNTHNDNLNNIGTDYNDQYILAMRENLCDNLDMLKINVSFSCNQFISGTTNEGLHPVMINFIETIRQILLEEKESLANFNDTKVWNLENISYYFIQPSFTYLKSSLKESFNESYKSESMRRLILYVCFIIFLLLVFVAIWIPFVNHMNRDIWRTKSMLTLIPMDVLLQIKNVQKFLTNENIFSSSMSKRANK